MQLEIYPLTANTSHTAFEFLSEGPKGTVKKVVQYQKAGRRIFNLAFGDWDEETQKIKDWTRTNNNDRYKVLSTVAASVIDFMENHPSAIIYAEGQTPARTRLYQMGIRQHLKAAMIIYEINGLYRGDWQKFKAGLNYDAFVLHLR